MFIYKLIMRLCLGVFEISLNLDTWPLSCRYYGVHTIHRTNLLMSAMHYRGLKLPAGWWKGGRLIVMVMVACRFQTYVTLYKWWLKHMVIRMFEGQFPLIYPQFIH